MTLDDEIRPFEMAEVLDRVVCMDALRGLVMMPSGSCQMLLTLEFGDLRSATNVWPQLIDHTPPDTQERIDGDATMPPRAYYAKRIGHDVGLKDDAECTEAMVRHLLNRQRKLDGRMMGGAE